MRRVRGYMEGFGLNAMSCLRRGQTIGKANGLVRDLSSDSVHTSLDC
jgi:hypothetical protein